VQHLWTSAGNLEPTLPLLIAAILALTLFAAGISLDIVLLAGLLKRRWSWREPMDRLRRREWKYRDGAALIMALITAQLLFAWYAAGSGSAREDGTTIEPFLVVIQTLLFHGVCGAAILFLMWIRGTSWRRAFGNADPGFEGLLSNALRGVMLYAAAMPPVIVIACLYRLLLGAFNIPLEPQGVIDLFISADSPLWLRIYLGVLAVVVAPVIEETCFRGMVLPLLIRHNGAGLGIVATSVLFAAIHFHLPSLGPLFGIAVAFSLAYIYTGSLVTPIVMHALFNAVSIATLLLMQTLPQHLASVFYSSAY